MSGASNFEKLIKRKNTTEKPIDEKRKIGGLYNNGDNNELDFLAEDNQWASIQKYNDYL